MTQAHNPNAVGSVVPIWATIGAGPQGPIGPQGPPGPGLTLSAGVAIGATTVLPNIRQRYNPSGGTFTLKAPAAPALGDQFGVKNVNASVTAITIDGNGNNIVNPATHALVATFLRGGAFTGVDFVFDGTNWLDIGVT